MMFRLSHNSPSISSRFSSNPTRKKKTAIKPSLIHSNSGSLSVERRLESPQACQVTRRNMNAGRIGAYKCDDGRNHKNDAPGSFEFKKAGEKCFLCSTHGLPGV